MITIANLTRIQASFKPTCGSYHAPRPCADDRRHPKLGLKMSRLTGFFKGSDTTLGVFYPNHYLVAVFGDLQAAQDAVRKLRTAGFAEDETISAGGKEIVELATDETGLGGFLMQALSRLFATEQLFTDHDLEHARHGAGFLAVYCPTEKTKKDAWSVLEPETPLDARYYGTGGIEHLAGDLKTE
jgi:hypothetical protein